MLHPLLIVLGLHWMNDYLHSGWPGVIRTFCVAALLVLFSNWMTTRFRLTLKL
jgi:hypothetical protein